MTLLRGTETKRYPISNFVASFVSCNVFLVFVIKNELLIYPFPPTIQSNQAASAHCLLPLYTGGPTPLCIIHIHKHYMSDIAFRTELIF